MTNKPTISCIVPTRNRAGLLSRALRTIRDQTFPDLEVIVVDDASADETPEAAAALGARVLSHDAPRGAGAARNTGLRAVRGAYVAFLDDDDEWLPRKLERQLACLEEAGPETGVVSCAEDVVSDVTGRVVNTANVDPGPATVAAFLASTRFATSVPLIRTSCFDAVGLFDAELPGSQDRDMWVRLAAHTRFAHVPEVLVRRHVHGRQISTDLAAKTLAKQLFLSKHEVALRAHPEVFAEQLERLGLMYFVGGDADNATGCFERALELDGSRTSTRKHIARCREAPEEHRRHIVDNVFKNVDGITLYY